MVKKSKQIKDTAVNNEIALKLKYLLDNYTKANGERYSYTEIAELTGGQIDHSWLSKLASGQATRPGLQVLKALTSFFKIDASFWFRDLEEWKAEYENQQIKLTDKEINAQKIALRASSLDEDSQQIVLDLIQSLENSITQKRKKGQLRDDA
jgi:transcriptional regulator with XRE-family HTH domain